MLLRIILIGVCLLGVSLPSTVAQASDPKLVITPLGPLNRAVGDTLFLRCKLEPESAKDVVSNIRWLNPAGDLIGVATREGDRLYTRDAELYFTSLVKEDSGDYTCMAEQPGHGQLKTLITLDVFQGIKFENVPSPQNPITGTDGKIQCEVSGNPAPEVEWIRDGRQIKTEGRYKIDTDGLAITGINEDDEGEYTCRAVVPQTGGLDSRKIKVEVWTRPTFKDGQSAPESVRGIEQKSASLDCGATGKPDPTVTWTFIPSGEDVLKTEDEQGTHHHTVDPITGTLTVRDLLKRHEGDYRCLAENSAGKIEKISRITVAEIPRFDILTNVTESEGTSATLHCTVRGDPVPTLRYVKEGRLEPFTVGGDPRITVVENERDLKLTINQLTREDDGLYVCIANNEAGTAEKSSHITVKFKPSLANTPQSVAKSWLENQEPVNLTCIAESIPNATIRWEKKQSQLLSLPPMRLITDQFKNIKLEQRGPSSSILVTANSLEDYGEYECIAENELGIARHTITLHQATAPGRISLVDFAEVTATTIRFNLEGPNEPNNLDLQGYVVYYHEAGVGSWSNTEMRAWPIGIAYTLDNLIPGRRYNFRFHAENAIGKSLASRDYERLMPDVGPPRPPGLLAAGNDSAEPTRYRLDWLEPADNGARILDYQIRYWKEGEENRPSVKTIPPASFYILTGLQPSTRYFYELAARNERGVGPSSSSNFTTAHASSVAKLPQQAQSGSRIPSAGADYASVLMSTPVIVGIAVGALLLLLLLIDICLYCTARRGLIAFICLRFCGQSKNLKDDGDTEKMRTVDETDLHYEKQPLTTTVTETTLKTTYREAAELEPEDKPSPH